MERRKEQRPYSGPDQRLNSDEHNEICDRRLQAVKDTFCLKLTNIKTSLDDIKGSFKPVWTVLGVVLVAFVVNGAVAYSQNEGMKSINATQEQKIKNIEKNFEKIESRIDGHHREQVEVNNKILDKLDALNEYLRDHDH